MDDCRWGGRIGARLPLPWKIIYIRGPLVTFFSLWEGGFFLRAEAFLLLFLSMSFFLHQGSLFATFFSLGAPFSLWEPFCYIFSHVFSFVFYPCGRPFCFYGGLCWVATPPPLQKLLRAHMY